MECKTCKKTPNELFEYTFKAAHLGITPEEYVLKEESTYNPRTKKFYCDACFIKKLFKN